MSTEKGYMENSRLILNRCALNPEQRKRVTEGNESIENVIEHAQPTETPATDLEPK